MIDQDNQSQPPVQPQQCGYIAIVGRPNVGKSTLLNRILGQKISITSSKPQTTRHQILGVKTLKHRQMVFIDTPGMHRGQARALNRYMNQAAGSALDAVDLVLFMVERLKWTDQDEQVLQKLKGLRAPVILLINKVDQIKDKQRLMPHLQKLNEKMEFAELFPLSADKGHNVAELERCILAYLPQADHHFSAEEVTNRSLRFISAEMIREKAMRLLGDELPYGLTVEIERFDESASTVEIHGLIWVERDSQKKIVIGDQGERIKQIGSLARKDIEQLIDARVMLHLWVKVKSGWADNERALRSLGYD